MARRVSFEIVPGESFPQPPPMLRASYRVKAKAQKLAQQMFEADLLHRLAIEASVARIAPGGWKGTVSPSSQIRFPTRVPLRLLRAYAAALGLIWRQDAVAVSRLHPRGRRLAVVLRRTDGRGFMKTQAERLYRQLRRFDAKKEATIGFMEVAGALVFINAGGLSDDEFQKTLVEIAGTHLRPDVYLDLARADFELEWSDWSTDHGERYRKRIREVGRSDLLHWIEAHARPQAEEFLKEFDWSTGKLRAEGQR